MTLYCCIYWENPNPLKVNLRSGVILPFLSKKRLIAGYLKVTKKPKIHVSDKIKKLANT